MIIKSYFILVTHSAERPRYEKIVNGYHNNDTCEDYCRGYKRHYGESFVCQFHGKEKIKELLLKNPNVPSRARNDPYAPYIEKTLKTENIYKLTQVTHEVYV